MLTFVNTMRKCLTSKELCQKGEKEKKNQIKNPFKNVVKLVV